MMEKSLELLTNILKGERQIYSLLSQLLKSQQNKAKLGLCYSQFIYIGGDNNSWYFFRDGKQVAIAENTLIFRLKKIYIGEKLYKNKPNLKLRVVCDCGENQYTLESGIKTYFSRSLILALLIAFRDFKADKNSIFKLGIQSGDEGVVFPHFYLNGEYLKANNCESINVSEVLKSKFFKDFV